MKILRKLWSKVTNLTSKKYPIVKIRKQELSNYIEWYFSEYSYLLKELMDISPNIKYWQAYFLALCEIESNFDINCTYREGYPLYYDSVGLFQLSIQDKRGYPDIFALVESNDDLRNGLTNARLAILILNRLYSKHNQTYLDKYSYWSTLRVENKNHKRFLNLCHDYLMKLTNGESL